MPGCPTYSGPRHEAIPEASDKSDEKFVKTHGNNPFMESGDLRNSFIQEGIIGEADLKNLSEERQLSSIRFRNIMSNESGEGIIIVHPDVAKPRPSCFAESCPSETVVLVVPSGGLVDEVVDEGLVDEAPELGGGVVDEGLVDEAPELMVNRNIR
ncbi:hypothetical protein BGY98DRAFT_936394 [Russula aff. rugulosa BPL654]|nr:hypothetical protein BGY98DRAFT_936394 [Russula aff. rugulosa BPL654]